MKMILTSGWASPATQLEPLVERLSQRFDVTAFTIRDLADATLETGNSKLEGTVSPFAHGLISRLEKIDEPVILAGWSMGGLISQEAAYYAPDKVAGLVLLTTTSKFCRTRDYTCGRAAAEVRAMGLGLRTFPETILTEFFKNVALPHTDSPDVIASRVADALSLGKDYLQQGLRYLVETDLRDHLPNIECPTLIVHGTEDAIIPFQAAEFMQEHFPTAKIEAFHGQGHDLPLRCVSEVAEAIEQQRRDLTQRRKDAKNYKEGRS